MRPVHGHRRRLALDRHLARLFRRNVPRVREVEVRHVLREVLRIGQARAGVLRRELRDRAGLGDGLAQRIRAEVARARAALARAEIHGNAHAAVALVLDGLDLPEPRTDARPDVHADRSLGLARTEDTGFTERKFDECEQVGAVCGQCRGMVRGDNSRAHRAAASMVRVPSGRAAILAAVRSSALRASIRKRADSWRAGTHFPANGDGTTRRRGGPR